LTPVRNNKNLVYFGRIVVTTDHGLHEVAWFSHEQKLIKKQMQE